MAVMCRAGGSTGAQEDEDTVFCSLIIWENRVKRVASVHAS